MLKEGGFVVDDVQPTNATEIKKKKKRRQRNDKCGLRIHYKGNQGCELERIARRRMKDMVTLLSLPSISTFTECLIVVIIGTAHTHTHTHTYIYIYIDPTYQKLQKVESDGGDQSWGTL
jgi:uncharacterized protein YcsI (UPF0317 family)